MHEGSIRPIFSAPTRPPICHLLFADDILIFRAFPRDAAKLCKLFSLYKDSSGQRLNLGKSLIFMGRCSPRSSIRIKAIFKFRSATFPSSYLGVPLLLGSPRQRHFDALLAVTRQKLTGWRANSLSFIGRLVLVKHVLASLSLHIAMALPLPISVCKSLEKCFMNFLWFASWEKRKLNSVGWEKVCLPKSEGGLGLRHLQEVNRACSYLEAVGLFVLPPFGLLGSWIDTLSEVSIYCPPLVGLVLTFGS